MSSFAGDQAILSCGALPVSIADLASRDSEFRAKLILDPRAALGEVGVVWSRPGEVIILPDDTLLRHYTLPWIDPRLAARGPEALRRNLAREIEAATDVDAWLPCQILQAAATDGSYRIRLLSDPQRALAEFDVAPPAPRIVVLANGAARTYLPLRFRPANDFRCARAADQRAASPRRSRHP